VKKVNTVPVRMGDKHLVKLDRLRDVAPDKPTRSEIVRRLIEGAQATP
jgi:hypothetical protein